jgi:hypothetical protein
MTLLVTVFAAVIATVIWYSDKVHDMNLPLLMYLFWGASIMWLVDAIMEYAELGAKYFTPSGADMLNDLFLGLSVVALALVVWTISLLIRDPGGTIRKKAGNRKE